VGTFYFHDTPLEGADRALLLPLEGPFPPLDPILADIPARTEGELYADRELTSPVPARDVLSAYGEGAAVVILGDGGAARGRYDLLRLLDTVAFLKGLRAYSSRVVWLNPMPLASWAKTSAAEIARHLPMFPMDRAGMHRAVNVLRGQPQTVEKPLPAGLAYRGA
jgi:uncharacterized protein